MKYAVIDVGTNNVLFLIADYDGKKIDVLHRDSNISAMGKHMQDGNLTAAGIHRTKNILRDNIRFAQMFTKNVIVIGTSCSREAKNISEVSDWIKTRFGLDYHIISGDQEALLNGLAVAHEFPDLPNIITFDLGGGSTEFTVIKDGKITFTQSLDLGIRRLDNELIEDFEIKVKATQKLIRELKLPELDSFELIGIGGSVTSLSAYRYHLQKYKPALIHKSRLRTVEVEHMLEEFKDMTDDEISYMMPFDRYRADIITTGTMIVDEILKFIKKDEFLISDRGMQFGVLLQAEKDLKKML
jgi:exopolyphosphatase / guanosine-5'-triphosphate,3'-diphosphate pyrophosphatase